jgi:hypothetical protein
MNEPVSPNPFFVLLLPVWFPRILANMFARTRSLAAFALFATKKETKVNETDEILKRSREEGGSVPHMKVFLVPKIKTRNHELGDLQLRWSLLRYYLSYPSNHQNLSLKESR